MPRAPSLGVARRHFAEELRVVSHIGSERVVAGEERKQPLELWKWIILLALILLMLEWYIYNRRIYI